MEKLNKLNELTNKFGILVREIERFGEYVYEARGQFDLFRIEYISEDEMFVATPASTMFRSYNDYQVYERQAQQVFKLVSEMNEILNKD